MSVSKGIASDSSLGYSIASVLYVGAHFTISYVNGDPRDRAAGAAFRFFQLGRHRPRYDFFIFSFLYVCQLWHSASLVEAIGTKSRSCGPIQPLYGKAPHMLSAP